MTKSEQMARITGNNLKPETRMAAAFDEAGVAYERNVRGLPGTPDFVVGKVALFVNGCFFHRCWLHHKAPKTNVEFWTRKFEANVRRDRLARRRLERMGFAVITVWEHQTKKSADLGPVVRRAQEFAVRGRGNIASATQTGASAAAAALA